MSLADHVRVREIVEEETYHVMREWAHAWNMTPGEVVDLIAQREPQRRETS